MRKTVEVADIQVQSNSEEQKGLRLSLDSPQASRITLSIVQKSTLAKGKTPERYGKDKKALPKAAKKERKKLKL